MATLTSTGEEVVIVRMGDLYFFPCALPHGSELHDIGPDTQLYPCIGQQFFVLAINAGHLLQTTQEGLTDYRIRLSLDKVWRYLVGKGSVIGDSPEIVDATPSFNPVSVS